jgi:hypothetical protein
MGSVSLAETIKDRPARAIGIAAGTGVALGVLSAFPASAGRTWPISCKLGEIANLAIGLVLKAATLYNIF